MPNPLGHALAGIAAGSLILSAGPKTRGAEGPRWQDVVTDRNTVIFALCGVLPDIDFLFGTHSGVTHSVGATVVVALVGAVWAGSVAGSKAFSVALGCAYGSHVLLDWLGSDFVAPYGVMALWPWSDHYYLSERRWFWSVCREYQVVTCWAHNAVGAIRELLILGPLAAMGVAVRRYRARLAP